MQIPHILVLRDGTVIFKLALIKQMLEKRIAFILNECICTVQVGVNLSMHAKCY